MIANGRRLGRVVARAPRDDALARRRADGAVPRLLRRRLVRAWTRAPAGGLPWYVAVSKQVDARTPRGRDDADAAHPRRRALAGVRAGRLPVLQHRRADHRACAPASPWRTRPARPTRASAPAAVGLLVHELAHQWFGDSVSVARWRDIWLNEGVGDLHGGALGRGARRPQRPAQPWLRPRRASRAARRLLAARDRRPRPGRPVRRRRSTERGAMTLQALRHRIGDAAFRTLLRPLALRAGGRQRQHRGLRGARRERQRAGPRRRSSTPGCAARSSRPARRPTACLSGTAGLRGWRGEPRRDIVILGSTGSIGTQALDLVRAEPRPVPGGRR